VTPAVITILDIRGQIGLAHRPRFRLCVRIILDDDIEVLPAIQFRHLGTERVTVPRFFCVSGHDDCFHLQHATVHVTSVWSTNVSILNNPFEPSREAALVTVAGNGIKAALAMLVKERNVPLNGLL
jgi:hypothetical protein